MSYSSLPSSLARAFQPQVDPDEMERQRRIKLAALTLPDESMVARASSGIIAPPERLYGGDSSLPPRAVQGGDSSLPAMNAPSRAIQPTAASASPNTIPMTALRAPAPGDGQANFERITTPRATMPVAESNAPRLNTPPDGMHVGFDKPMSAIQPPTDGLGYGEGRGRASNDPYSAIAPGRAQQELERMQTAGPHKAGGWERAGRAILDVLTGNPIGAGAEIFAPGYMARQRFERSDLPMAQRNAQIEQGMGSQRVGDIARIANETGRLPDNTLTEPARARQEQHQYNVNKERELEADRKARLDETTRWHKETGGYRDRAEKTKAMNAELRNIAPFGTMTPEAKAAFEAKYGVSLPADFDARKHQMIDTGEGWQSVVTATGQGQIAVDATGKPLASPKGASLADKQRHEKEMESQGRQHIGIAQQNTDISRARMQSGNNAAHREALSGIKDHERAKAQAVQYQEKAARFDQQAAAATNDKDIAKFKGQAEEARGRAEYYKDYANRKAEELGADYPEHVEAGKGQDGWGYVKPRQGARTTGPASRSTAPSAAPAPARTITKADYDARVKQHGQAAVDEQLKKLGITVQ